MSDLGPATPGMPGDGFLHAGDVVVLKAVTPADYRTLYDWRCSDDVHYLSFDPNTTVFTKFAEWLDDLRRQNAVVLVIDKKTGEPAGYFLTYLVDMWDGWAYWASYIAPKFRMTRMLVEAMIVASGLLFNQFPFRKLYVEVYEFAERLASHLESMGYMQEGFTPNHSLVVGQPTGVWTYAIYRETWERETALRSQRSGQG